MEITKKRGIIDALFWRLHTSYLKNDRLNSEKFLGMLSDYSDEQLKEEILDIHFNRFLTIKNNIKNSLFGRIYGEGFSTPFSNSPKKEASCQELEFSKKLTTIEGKNKLCELFNCSNKTSFSREFDLKEFGRLDLYGKDLRRIILCEVKVGTAPNSLPSQIDRYRLAVELNMCLGMYDKVDAFVAAESYTNYDAIELSRLSVKMIEHKGTIESMRLL